MSSFSLAVSVLELWKESLQDQSSLPGALPQPRSPLTSTSALLTKHARTSQFLDSSKVGGEILSRNKTCKKQQQKHIR